MFLFRRSREDLVERKKEEEVKAIRQEDTLGKQEEFEKEEDEFEEEEDEEDVTFDETDGKLTTMESTSQWVTISLSLKIKNLCLIE